MSFPGTTLDSRTDLGNPGHQIYGVLSCCIRRPVESHLHPLRRLHCDAECLLDRLRRIGTLESVKRLR